MIPRRPIGLKGRQRILELTRQGLSAQQIAERLNIAYKTVWQILVKGLGACGRCGRILKGGNPCPVCSLPAGAPFAERLRAFRMVIGLSQWKLATMVDVDCSKVRQWESGQ